MDIGGYPEQVHLGVKWISNGYPLDIHFWHGYPFFVCYGELLIYRKGKWGWLGNQGSTLRAYLA